MNEAKGVVHLLDYEETSAEKYLIMVSHAYETFDGLPHAHICTDYTKQQTQHVYIFLYAHLTSAFIFLAHERWGLVWRKHPTLIFQEYAPHGELWDKIAEQTDTGKTDGSAFTYMSTYITCAACQLTIVRVRLGWNSNKAMNMFWQLVNPPPPPPTPPL